MEQKKKIKLRTVWDFDPTTRIKQSKKSYNRHDWKREIDEELYEEEIDNNENL